ncbi:SIMPL domain-containing protein [Stakelama saccharophila]|uniref:SIMPL domain-containing protein n=1 Tax=Stakelama saccharophila TaxID=3075605 RepID=A0ABZ0BB24_9SPHN|nr:SIMPL domain-containing protein [Stakelama sp. W311]WNO53876.1 SIMPL domain-containing protein [Stakelama sp. W311]
MQKSLMLIGAAILCAPVASARAQDTAPGLSVPAGSTLLEVSAEGTASRVPDLATIRAGVVTQASTAGAAMQANADRMEAVLAALDAAGVAERDIQTAAISLNPQYRHTDDQPPAITGYQASNSVSVKFRDIDKAGPILDALVKQGANQISGPDLTVDAMDAARDEARRDAVRRARAKAALYAQAAGLKVARILSISEGAQSAPPPMPVHVMRMEASSATTKIAAGQQDVTVDLTVRFLLD